jgi:hypothetical protein
MKYLIEERVTPELDPENWGFWSLLYEEPLFKGSTVYVASTS